MTSRRTGAFEYRAARVHRFPPRPSRRDDETLYKVSNINQWS